MKIIIKILIVLSAIPAYSASVSLTLKDWYSQSYMTTSTLVPNKEKIIEIELDSTGAGEFQMPTRNYSFRWSWDYSNDTQIDQKIRIQDAYKSCQVIFETVMNLRYCSAKKLQAGEDCDVNDTVTKLDTFLCADLTTQSRESVIKYDLWESLNNGADLRYVFSNSTNAKKLKLKLED